MAEQVSSSIRLPRGLVFFLILGLYLTLRGYHSRDNDQAYRLPLLLHRQNPALFADDPFVQAFDIVQPASGYLAVLDLASRPLGLSAGLLTLFALTLAVTCHGIDRLAVSAWPESGRGSSVGLVAIGLVLTAKAGNIGTVHVFEAMLLDRLIGLALGWLALAWVVDRPERGAAYRGAGDRPGGRDSSAFGLQLAMLLGGSWMVWALAPGVSGSTGGRRPSPWPLGLGLVPWGFLYLGEWTRLFAGLPLEEFRRLSVELQNPQHSPRTSGGGRSGWPSAAIPCSRGWRWDSREPPLERFSFESRYRAGAGVHPQHERERVHLWG